MLELVLLAAVGVAAYWFGLRQGRQGFAAAAVDARTPPPAPAAPPVLSFRDGSARTAPASLPSGDEIAEAIEAGEFIYHVQPIFDVDAGRAVGVEALSRWERPDGTEVAPIHFLPAMQRNYAAGVRPPLDRTAETARPFTDAGLFCAFNVSAAFLDRGGDETGWIDEFVDALDASRIVLEITEGSIISHPAKTRRLIDALRERGLRFALDDFGTGLSNLERLQTYPVDFVKVDGAFVRGPTGDREDAILRGLTAIAADIGAEVVAEGVETEGQRERAREAGIRLMQGYLLGRPAPVQEWTDKLGLSARG